MRPQVERQIHQQLLATLFREEVDDAVDRLVGTVGVQRGEAEVAGFGKGDGVIHRLAVANLAHQDDVRRLAQRILQCRFPGIGVDADLALRDDAVLVLVDELDRVFDGNDVAVAVAVAVIDQRRQRRRFAGAGAADEDDQTALGHRDVLEHGRQPEFVEGRNASC